MATMQGTLQTASVSNVRHSDRPTSGFLYNMLYLVLAFWTVAGAYVDGWAHNHGAVDDTFFTVWHALLYSGFISVALFVIGTHLFYLRRGYAWSHTMPVGYELALIGVGVFALGGVGDMIWHLTFGIEVGAETVLSPTHMMLALGVFLFAGAPLRAAWAQRGLKGWNGLVAALWSAALIWSVISFMSSAIHPLSYAVGIAYFLPTDDFQVWIRQMYSFGGTIIHIVLLMGFALLLLRRWGARLPLGWLTFVLTINAIGMALEGDEWRFLPAIIVGGIVGDILIRRIHPTAENLRAVHFIAFVVPVIIYTFFFLALALTESIWWRAHSVTGSILLAGITGLLMSYLVFPSSIPAEAEPA